MRRIGMISQFSESNPDAQANLAAFRRRLADLGWLKVVTFSSTSAGNQVLMFRAAGAVHPGFHSRPFQEHHSAREWR
jgi:hypothetical protein